MLECPRRLDQQDRAAAPSSPSASRCSPPGGDAQAIGFGESLSPTLGQPLNSRHRATPAGRDARPRMRAAEVLSGDEPGRGRAGPLGRATGDGRTPDPRHDQRPIDEPVVNVTAGCLPRLSRRFVRLIDPPLVGLAQATGGRSARRRCRRSADRSRRRRSRSTAAGEQAPATAKAGPASEREHGARQQRAPGLRRRRARRRVPSGDAERPGGAAARRAPQPPRPGRGPRLRLESARRRAERLRRRRTPPRAPCRRRCRRRRRSAGERRRRRSRQRRRAPRRPQRPDRAGSPRWSRTSPAARNRPRPRRSAARDAGRWARRRGRAVCQSARLRAGGPGRVLSVVGRCSGGGSRRAVRRDVVGLRAGRGAPPTGRGRCARAGAPGRARTASGSVKSAGEPETEPAALDAPPRAVDRRPRGHDGDRQRRLAPPRPAAAATPPAAVAPAARLGAASVEELIDLEQQADFFVVLGQDEAAIDLLMGHVRSTGGVSPLPYLKLLEIYRRRGEREAYERVRERFNRRFNAYAPDWDADLQQGRALDEYRRRCWCGCSASGRCRRRDHGDARRVAHASRRCAARTSNCRPTANCCSCTRSRATSPSSRPPDGVDLLLPLDGEAARRRSSMSREPHDGLRADRPAGASSIST